MNGKIDYGNKAIGCIHTVNYAATVTMVFRQATMHQNLLEVVPPHSDLITEIHVMTKW